MLCVDAPLDQYSEWFQARSTLDPHTGWRKERNRFFCLHDSDLTEKTPCILIYKTLPYSRWFAEVQPVCIFLNYFNRFEISRVWCKVHIAIYRTSSSYHVVLLPALCAPPAEGDNYWGRHQTEIGLWHELSRPVNSSRWLKGQMFLLVCHRNRTKSWFLQQLPVPSLRNS